MPFFFPRFCSRSRQLLLRPFLLQNPHQNQQRATFVDAKVRWVRDRGLDHAVEREKHLRPLLAIKDLLLPSSTGTGTNASPSLPLSAIAERRDQLGLPFRAIRFIRRYPSTLIEEENPQKPPPPPPLSPSPSSASPPNTTTSSSNLFQPLVRPTPELVRLHEEELSVYESCRSETADRLLRVLMLTRRKSLPLQVVDLLRWDLGLPQDYARSLLPEYPDYFQIAPSPHDQRLHLELVCWNRDLAVSAMESRVAGKGYSKGDPLAFPQQFSRGFDMDKRVKKWMDDWQKLPYMSPYEDGTRLDSPSALAEKWTVGVLHELLHLLVPKKTDKENLLVLGEHIGLRPAFKKALVNYPGIFYVSNKNGTYTVVLRDAYKRDVLIEKHPLMGMWHKYVHLMHKGMEEGPAARNRDKGGKNSIKGPTEDDTGSALKDEDDDDDYDEEEEEEEGELSHSSDSESEQDMDKCDFAINEKNSTPGGMLRNPREARIQVARTKRSSNIQLNSIEKRLQTRKVYQSPRRGDKQKQTDGDGSVSRSQRKRAYLKAGVRLASDAKA